MRKQRHTSRLARLAAAGGTLAFAAAAPAAAEPMFKLGQKLPMMLVRVCPALAEAKLEANLAFQQSKEPFRDGTFKSDRNPRCLSVFVVVVPESQEAEIRPFIAWALAYDPASARTIKSPKQGEAISVTFRRVLVRYYSSRVRDARGDWYVAWVELPDEPYMLKYVEQQQRAR